MYIAVDCCSQRDTAPVMFSVLPYSTITIQILYKLYSLQLNCTYTEAAATCSAAQHDRNCVAVFCSGVRPVVWKCICTDRQSHPEIRSFKEFTRLKSHCHNLTALLNTRLTSYQATARHLSWPTPPLGCDDVIQRVGGKPT